MLGLVSFVTSVIAAVIGFGGGMLLIAILPIFLAPSLIIPIHGITQLASNSSRMLFSFSSVRWELLPKFLAGSLIGTLLFGFFLSSIPVDYVPAAIGTYILLNLWNQRFSAFMKKFESYYLIGFLQTGVGLIVGATGPLSLSVLTKQLKSNDEIIATSSMFMTISHLAKIPVYFVITADLFSNQGIIYSMIAGSILGSFVGTKLRLNIKNDAVIWLIKLLLTLLGIRMLALVFI